MEMDINWYELGRIDGEIAARSNGGTRGAEWNANQKSGLKSEDKEDYIQGFNDALDEGCFVAGI